MPRAFWVWAGWRDRGGIPAQRPQGLPARIPASWWPRYLLHRGLIRPVRKAAQRNLSPAQYVLFAASDPLSALAAPARYAVALSADPAFADWATAETVAALRARGHRVYAWCDCDVEKGTPAWKAIDLAVRLKLDGWIGQAESPDQFDNAYGYSSPISPSPLVAIVGNLTALAAGQRLLLEAWGVPWIQEDFWCDGWALLRDDRVAAVMHGTYPGTIWAPTIIDYKQAGRWQPGDGLFHVAAVTDWKELP